LHEIRLFDTNVSLSAQLDSQSVWGTLQLPVMINELHEFSSVSMQTKLWRSVKREAKLAD